MSTTLTVPFSTMWSPSAESTSSVPISHAVTDWTSSSMSSCAARTVPSASSSLSNATRRCPPYPVLSKESSTVWVPSAASGANSAVAATGLPSAPVSGSPVSASMSVASSV